MNQNQRLIHIFTKLLFPFILKSAVASSTDTLEDLLKQQKDAVSSVEKSGALLNVLKKALQVVQTKFSTFYSYFF